MAECEAKWAAFVSDPEWHAAKSASEADGQIVENIANQFLMPTAFSKLK